MPTEVHKYEQLPPEMQGVLKEQARYINYSKGRRVNPKDLIAVIDRDEEGKAVDVKIEETPSSLAAAGAAAVYDAPSTAGGLLAGTAASALTPVVGIAAGIGTGVGIGKAQDALVEKYFPSVARKMAIYRATSPLSTALGGSASAAGLQKNLLLGGGKAAYNELTKSGGNKLVRAVEALANSQGMTKAQLLGRVGMDAAIGAGTDAGMQLAGSIMQPGSKTIGEHLSSLDPMTSLGSGLGNVVFGGGRTREFLRPGLDAVTGGRFSGKLEPKLPEDWKPAQGDVGDTVSGQFTPDGIEINTDPLNFAQRYKSAWETVLERQKANGGQSVPVEDVLTQYGLGNNVSLSADGYQQALDRIKVITEARAKAKETQDKKAQALAEEQQQQAEAEARLQRIKDLTGNETPVPAPKVEHPSVLNELTSHFKGRKIGENLADRKFWETLQTHNPNAFQLYVQQMTVAKQTAELAKQTAEAVKKAQKEADDLAAKQAKEAEAKRKADEKAAKAAEAKRLAEEKKAEEEAAKANAPVAPVAPATIQLPDNFRQTLNSLAGMVDSSGMAWSESRLRKLFAQNRKAYDELAAGTDERLLAIQQQILDRAAQRGKAPAEAPASGTPKPAETPVTPDTTPPVVEPDKAPYNFEDDPDLTKHLEEAIKKLPKIKRNRGDLDNPKQGMGTLLNEYRERVARRDEPPPQSIDQLKAGLKRAGNAYLERLNNVTDKEVSLDAPQGESAEGRTVTLGEKLDPNKAPTVPDKENKRKASIEKEVARLDRAYEDFEIRASEDGKGYQAFKRGTDDPVLGVFTSTVKLQAELNKLRDANRVEKEARSKAEREAAAKKQKDDLRAGIQEYLDEIEYTNPDENLVNKMVDRGNDILNTRSVEGVSPREFGYLMAQREQGFKSGEEGKPATEPKPAPPANPPAKSAAKQNAPTIIRRQEEVPTRPVKTEGKGEGTTVTPIQTGITRVVETPKPKFEQKQKVVAKHKGDFPNVEIVLTADGKYQIVKTTGSERGQNYGNPFESFTNALTSAKTANKIRQNAVEVEAREVKNKEQRQQKEVESKRLTENSKLVAKGIDKFIVENPQFNNPTFRTEAAFRAEAAFPLSRRYAEDLPNPEQLGYDSAKAVAEASTPKPQKKSTEETHKAKVEANRDQFPHTVVELDENGLYQAKVKATGENIGTSHPNWQVAVTKARNKNRSIERELKKADKPREVTLQAGTKLTLAKPDPTLPAADTGAKPQGTSPAANVSFDFFGSSAFNHLPGIAKLVGRLVKGGVQKAAKAAEVLTEMPFRGVGERLRQLFPATGEHLRQVGKLLRNRTVELHNRFDKPVDDAIRALRPTEKEIAHVREFMDMQEINEGFAPYNLTDRERRLMEALKSSLMDSASIPNSPWVENTREKAINEFYAAGSVMAADVRQELKARSAKGEKLRREYIEWYKARTNSANPTQAENAANTALDLMIGSGKTKMDPGQPSFAAVRKAEGIGLPPSMREQNIVNRVYYSNARTAADLAYHQVIERNPATGRIFGHINTGAGVDYYPKDAQGNLIKDIDKMDPADAEKFRIPGSNDYTQDLSGNEYLEAVRGELLLARSANPDLTEKIAGLVNSWRLGPTTTIRDIGSSLAPLMTHVPIGEWKNLDQALKGMFGNATGHGYVRSKNEADRNTTESAVYDGITKLSEFARKWSGRELGEKGVRSGIGMFGEIIGKNQYEKAIQGGESAFLDYIVGKNWRSLPKEDVMRIAGQGLMEQVQGNYTWDYLPKSLLRSDEGKVIRWIFNLQRWSVERARRFREEVILPMAKTGDIKPLVKQTIGGLIGAAGVESVLELVFGQGSRMVEAKDMAKMLMSEVDTPAKVDEVVHELTARMQMMGIGGIFAALANNLNQLRHGESMLPFENPAWSAIGDMITRTVNAVEGMGVPFKDVGAVKFFSKLAFETLMDEVQMLRVIRNRMEGNTGEDRRMEDQWKRVSGQTRPAFKLAQKANRFSPTTQLKRAKTEEEVIALEPALTEYYMRRGLKGPTAIDNPIRDRGYYQYLSTVRGPEEAEMEFEADKAKKVLVEKKKAAARTAFMRAN